MSFPAFFSAFFSPFHHWQVLTKRCFFPTTDLSFETLELFSFALPTPFLSHFFHDFFQPHSVPSCPPAPIGLPRISAEADLKMSTPDARRLLVCICCFFTHRVDGPCSLHCIVFPFDFGVCELPPFGQAIFVPSRASKREHLRFPLLDFFLSTHWSAVCLVVGLCMPGRLDSAILLDFSGSIGSSSFRFWFALGPPMSMLGGLMPG